MGCNPAWIPSSPSADAVSAPWWGFTPWQRAACRRRVAPKKKFSEPMNTTLNPNIAEEESKANDAARRFMHLLRHPEEQNRDGIQSDRNRLMNDMTRPSFPEPMTASKNKESVITTKLRKTGRVTAKAKPKDIAYWIAKATEQNLKA